MNKRYNHGIILGRMQPIHNGHVRLIETAIEFCETVTICVGSANESRNPRNPLTFEEREILIKAVCDGIQSKLPEEKRSVINIIPISDTSDYFEDARYGDYVFDKLAEAVEEDAPDVIIGGGFPNEVYNRETWFSSKTITRIYIPRNTNNSLNATDIRNSILNDSEDNAKMWWEHTVHPAIRNYFTFVKCAIKEASEACPLNKPIIRRK